MSHAAHPSHAQTLRVLLPLPLGDGYDYLVPQGMEVEAGDFVSVPLARSHEVIGVVWGEGSGAVEARKLKAINGTLDVPPLDEATRRFVDWVATYTLTPAGAILKMLFGGRLRVLNDKDRLTNALAAYAAPLDRLDALAPNLTQDQRAAAQGLIEAVNRKAFSATLLDGVTGSGKTEVYSEAIAQCLKNGQQALVLLPEIAMTAALLSRIEKRFGFAPVLWHSGITEKQRRLGWHAIRQGQARLILGARSALFLPFADLGLIVVDEEHEGAYKQEEGVIYHGRDMAVVRGHLEGLPVILASATPSLETMHNVEQGKYGHVALKSRFGAAQMPALSLIDLRQEKMDAQTFISEPLLAALTETIAAGQQAMLFLNRRGYAPLTLCRACGYRLQCPSCTAWLIEHKRTGRLHCHQCGYNVRLPDACPACGAEDKFAACGPGIERIAQEVAERLPAARAAIVASDTLDSPKAAHALIEKMDNHSLDLLIGTQIMAKGYHFPRLTLVGVIDADLGLAGGDPRAAERTFQLLQQVAGRSGRAQEMGRVFLQTTQPEHPVMQALVSGERDAFFAAELRERQNYHLPPFGRLATITLSGANGAEVEKAARLIATAAPTLGGANNKAAPQKENLRILGPAPAPYALLRGKVRHRLMVQAARSVPLPALIQSWLAPLTLPRTIKVQVDIDPYSFL